MHLRQSLVPLLGFLLIASAAMARPVVLNRATFSMWHFAHLVRVRRRRRWSCSLCLVDSSIEFRLLSARYGNPLPADQIAQFIDGRVDVKAHGLRDMPVWGETAWVNPEGTGRPNEIKSWVAKVVAYLESIQKGEQTPSRVSL